MKVIEYDFAYCCGNLYMDLWEQNASGEAEFIRTLMFNSIGEGFRWMESHKAEYRFIPW